MAKEKHEPAEWRQSTTDFHKDWAEAENKGDSIKWKQGLSFGEGEASTRHKAQIAPRKGRGLWRWLLLFCALGLLAFGLLQVPEAKAIAIVLFEGLRSLLSPKS